MIVDKRWIAGLRDHVGTGVGVAPLETKVVVRLTKSGRWIDSVRAVQGHGT
jgi:hypothetical protein